MVNQFGLSAAALAAVILSPSAIAAAQQQSEEAAASAVEPTALAALETMGKFLIGLQAFEVRGETTTDEVLVDTGQKIQLASTVEYKVQRPNRLFAEVISDRKHRQYIYDGKTVTVHAPKMSYYAMFDAPATIGETLGVLQERFALDMPLRDLFIWGTDAADPDAITGASDIGSSTINGEICDHYAYRQADVDWQLWLRQGEQPVPCKLVITTTDEESQPQYSAVLSWDLSPSNDDKTFTFTVPEGANRIAIVEAEPATDTEGNN